MQMNLTAAQRSSTEQGELFEQLCLSVVKSAGFVVIRRHKRCKLCGCETDILAENQHGITFSVDCKGSWNGDRPGGWRSDTVMKAGFVLICLHACGAHGRLLSMMSHEPERGSSVLKHAMTHRLSRFEDINPGKPEHVKRLRWLARATEDELDEQFAK